MSGPSSSLRRELATLAARVRANAGTVWRPARGPLSRSHFQTQEDSDDIACAAIPYSDFAELLAATERVEAEVAKARADAMEEAAKVCEARAEQARYGPVVSEIHGCAAAIQALAARLAAGGGEKESDNNKEVRGG